MDKQFLPRVDDDERPRLKISDLKQCPIAQFKLWYGEAMDQEKTVEPNSMALATALPNGKPSVRYMLLKYYDHQKFVFFTNYESRKSSEMESNPRVAAAFYWPTSDRQVCIEGTVKRCDPAFNDQYFQTRDLPSKLAGIFSHQSAEMTEQQRDELAKKVKEEAQIKKEDLHAPQNWGGYEIYPERIEFWVGQKSRMHDRFLYEKTGEKEWKIKMLYP